jgi:hypothetical protein
MTSCCFLAAGTAWVEFGGVAGPLGPGCFPVGAADAKASLLLSGVYYCVVVYIWTKTMCLLP